MHGRQEGTAGVSLLERILPPTIHPMVVHFPIAIAFLLLLSEVLAVVRPNDPFFARSGLYLYVLELVALVAAAVAGVISSHFAVPTAGVPALLAAHKRDAVLTGLAFSASFAVRLLPILSGRRRPSPSPASLALLAVGLTLLITTASLGGTMVYDHGLGVSLATRPHSTALPRRTGARSSLQGETLWQTTCSTCHGDPPPFSKAFVEARGRENLVTFIAQNMPPGNPVGRTAAEALVRYLEERP
jgi:uncharacterized membrane protein